MMTCQICKEDKVKVLLDCGPQSLCNRFVMDFNREEYRHPLVLGQCEACGLIQLTQPVPAEEIAPRFEWLVYNEPEEHLDKLADVICNLPGIDDYSVACGITYKDDTLLKRLEKKKLRRVWRIEPEKDLDINISGVGGETVLPRLTSESATRLVDKHGRADLVIARHVYEHAPDTHTLLEALKNLVSPSGYIVFEVPDCTRQLQSRDYGMLWEEHILYFTPVTFRNSFLLTNFSLDYYERNSYPVENALVAITKPIEREECAARITDTIVRELEMGNSYGQGFSKYAEKLQRHLKRYTDSNRRVAIFGAGHLSCMYINLMKIKDYLEFVVDDNPNKKGLYMPRSRLPIVGSHSLIDENISLCLLCLSPESEAKVIQKNQAYIKGGGTFVSISSANKNHLELGSIGEV